jgi:hypothetical protein
MSARRPRVVRRVDAEEEALLELVLEGVSNGAILDTPEDLVSLYAWLQAYLQGHEASKDRRC